MPKAHPAEFRRDVVEVARKREAPMAQIAKDFGISQSCLFGWLKQADIKPGRRCRTTASNAISDTTANEVWLTDITEHATSEAELYLCAAKDFYSNRIAGYSIDSRMKASLAVAALRNAIALRGNPTGVVVVHSDRGSQFRSTKYTHILSHHQLARVDGPRRCVC